MILGGVHRNPVQPGIEGAVATKPGQRTPGLDKGLLGNIHHLVLITHIAADQGKNAVLIFAHEQIESSLCTLAGILYEFFVRHLSPSTSTHLPETHRS